MCIYFLALIVRFSEITRTNQRPLDGENSVFTCNLLGGSNNISIDNEWSITLRNGTTLRISSNTSDLILLPPHNSSLIIVRHDRATFDRATVTCMGGRNFSGINAQLFIDCKCFQKAACIIDNNDRAGNQIVLAYASC